NTVCNLFCNGKITGLSWSSSFMKTEFSPASQAPFACFVRSDTTHDKNKTYHLVREVDKGLVAFDDILIERQTWNGQNVESCYVCNVEFSDENKHSNESSHILNVIQSKLELKRGKYVYRKIDDAVLNCLICNSLITVDSKESHAEDSDHTNNFIKCQNNYKKFKVQSAHTNTLREIIPTKTELRGKNGEEMNTDNMKLDVSMDNCNGEDYQKTESDCQKIIVFKVQNAHTEHTPKGTTDTELSVGVNGELTKADSKKLDVAIENCNDDGVEIDKENKKTESDCQKVNDFKVQNAHTEHTPKCTTDTELRFGVYGEGTKADSKKLNVAIESCNDNGIETDKENNKTESDCQKVNDLQVQNAHIEHTPQATTDTESSDGVNGEGTKTDSNKLDVAMENCN
ncbi:jg8084, partial [Pararge aegeria aegeria]